MSGQPHRSLGGGATVARTLRPMSRASPSWPPTGQVGGGDEDAHGRRKNILAGVRNLLAAIALAQRWCWSSRGCTGATSEPRRAERHRALERPATHLRADGHANGRRVLHVLEGVMRTELRGLSTEEQVRLVETRLGVRDGARQICGDLLPRVAATRSSCSRCRRVARARRPGDPRDGG